MENTQAVQDQQETVKVKTPLETALSVLRSEGGKLSKVEQRASEFDAKAAELNTEIAGMATGAIAQTQERNMLVAVKEQNAAAAKAEKIRKSGQTLASKVLTAHAELSAIVASITAAYPDAKAVEDAAEGEAVEPDEAADELDDVKDV